MAQYKHRAQLILTVAVGLGSKLPPDAIAHLSGQEASMM
jgi:hypothetical protein